MTITSHFSFLGCLLFAAVASASAAPLSHQADINIIDRALRSAKAGDPWVKFGDVGIKYSDLKAFRDRLAASDQKGPQIEAVTPPGTAFEWPSGNVNYRFDPIGQTNGTIFKMTTAGAVTTLHTFTGSDGANPVAGLIRATDGNLYGTTQLGGTSSKGTVFKITTAGTFTTLYNFSGSDGSSPMAGLVQAADGNLYGTTQSGGASSNGTVFKITTGGTLTTLYSFSGSDGMNPVAGLVQGAGADTNLYGTTQNGGTNGLGTIFKISTGGLLTTLHHFAGGNEGSNPAAGLIRATDGNFYGTTQFGGVNGTTSNAGTAFKITSAGTFTNIHSFNVSDGYQPVAALFQGSDTNFYGTTQYGGASSQGSVFKMTSAGVVTTLHSFVLNDGQQPVSGVIQAADGNYYGAVYRGGTNADGTAFKTTSGGTFTLLHTFIVTDGTEPKAGLVQGAGADTNFYGTTPGDNSITALKKQLFRDGVGEWAAFANLHFLEFTSGAAPTNFITVQENVSLGNSGFSSSVGVAGGEQFVQIGPPAWSHRTVGHEVGHALGLWHEQQRPDRDTYVTINFSNIPAGLQPNFAIIANGQTFGTTYDFYSVMHYTRNTFAINPNIDTIIMNAGYTQYADVIGNVYDRNLSKLERAGMAAIYGNPSPLPGAVVTNTNDSGSGSLRAAIYYAFDRSTDPSPAATTITFNIPTSDPNYNSGTGVFTIKPTFLLPALGNGTTIDGTSQTTFAGDTNAAGPEIALDGSIFAALQGPFGTYSPGLILRAANCTIKGLTIQNFNQPGIDMLQGSDPNGSAATGNVIGGTTPSARNVISGNAPYGIGIHDSTTTANIIEGNYIGTNQTGAAAQANTNAGVVIYLGAHGNTIGGPAANVLSGNTFQGIFIGDAGSNNNLIQGNYIGTNPTGTATVPNGTGIEIGNGAQSNTIGGTTSSTRNIISGNTFDGVLLRDAGTQNNLVEGNYIGLATNGSTPLPNDTGVEIYGGAPSNIIGGSSLVMGGTLTGAGNVISGNGNNGVLINGSNGTVIQGNFIGMDASGTAARANGTGVSLFTAPQNTLIGGTSAGVRNVISGNSFDGIALSGVSNTSVQGNYIGVDANGSTAAANVGNGVSLFSGATSNTIGGLISGARNVISGNVGDGVYMNGVSNNLVQGNYIGVDAAGSVARGNGGTGVDVFGGSQTNTIGGKVAAARNVIAASGVYDVVFFGSGTNGNTVLGNYVGLDKNGINGFGSNNYGVVVDAGAQNNIIGGTSGGSRNFICGHVQHGLFIAGAGSSGNLVQGNTIGLNVAGAAVGNGSAGIAAVAFFNSSQSNTVGGSAIGASNIISGNSNEGIAVYSFNTTTIKETFSRNSIYNNGGVGIALYDGGNNTQPAPTLSGAILSTPTNVSGTDVSGSLTAAASTQFTIEFFASPAGGDEGQFFAGSTTVTTNGAGTVNFNTPLPAAIPAGNVVTATATDPNGNTSTFSTTRTVTTTDSDGDGMPNNWENAHGLNPNVADANSDSDGDGMTNLQEFRAGTDPMVSSSRFAVASVDRASGLPRIGFKSISGKTYRLDYRDPGPQQYGTDLFTTGWQPLIDGIFGTGSTLQITDPSAVGVNRRFYRLVLEP